jgi:hypothetical protein
MNIPNGTNPPLGGLGGKKGRKLGAGDQKRQEHGGLGAFVPLCLCAFAPLRLCAFAPFDHQSLGEGGLRRYAGYTFLKNTFGILSIRF